MAFGIPVFVFLVKNFGADLRWLGGNGPLSVIRTPRCKYREREKVEV